MDLQKLFAFGVSLLLIVQGIATSWPAFSRKTIPEALSSMRNWRTIVGLFSGVAGLVLAASIFTSRPISVSEWESESEHEETVKDRTYRNEQVELDGKSFEDCSFYNVTLNFRGKHPFSVAHCHFWGPVLFKLANGPTLSGARAVWEMFREACEQFKLEPCPTNLFIVTAMEETPFILKHMRQGSSRETTRPSPSPP